MCIELKTNCHISSRSLWQILSTEGLVFSEYIHSFTDSCNNTGWLIGGCTLEQGWQVFSTGGKNRGKNRKGKNRGGKIGKNWKKLKKSFKNLPKF